MKKITIIILSLLVLLLGTACGTNQSDGSSAIAVPDMTGMNLEQAENAIKDCGLIVGNIDYDKTGAEPSTVTGQTPGAGEIVGEGTQIDLQVESGDE